MCIFAIWNMKGYFDTIPLDIEEAAKIDGAGDFCIMARIVLPLARPAIIVTAVMVLIYVWNEDLFATTFMLNESSYTLAGGLYQLQASDYSRSWSLFTAASVLVSVPILIIFFRIQKIHGIGTYRRRRKGVIRRSYAVTGSFTYSIVKLCLCSK